MPERVDSIALGRGVVPEDRPPEPDIDLGRVGGSSQLDLLRAGPLRHSPVSLRHRLLFADDAARFNQLVGAELYEQLERRPHKMVAAWARRPEA